MRLNQRLFLFFQCRYNQTVIKRPYHGIQIQSSFRGSGLPASQPGSPALYTLSPRRVSVATATARNTSAPRVPLDLRAYGPVLRFSASDGAPGGSHHPPTTRSLSLSRRRLASPAAIYIAPRLPPATLSTYLISSHTKNNQSKVPNHHDDDELVVSYTDLVPATR